MSLQIGLVATIACIAANLLIAAADYVRADFVLKNSAAVHVPERALPLLGTLKAAGAGGLTVGLAGWPWIGAAAGAGLTLFFIGAVIAHIRARVLRNIAGPGAYLLLAIASAAHMFALAAGS